MRPPATALSPALRRHALALRAAEARFARAIEALARAERDGAPSLRPSVRHAVLRRRLRAAEAAEARAGAAVSIAVESIAATPAAHAADLAFKLAVLARLLGVEGAARREEPLDRRLLRSALADATALAFGAQK